MRQGLHRGGTTPLRGGYAADVLRVQPPGGQDPLEGPFPADARAVAHARGRVQTEPLVRCPQHVVEGGAGLRAHPGINAAEVRRNAGLRRGRGSTHSRRCRSRRSR